MNRCRELLDVATKSVGCGINRAKSEVLLADKWTCEHVKSKTEFVWLGYSLKIDNQGYLTFTETRMNSSFANTRRMLNNTCQYCTRTGILMKIWKVYVAPVIEWYLPVIFTKRRDAGAYSHKIDSHQHQTLCTVLSCSDRLSKKDICKVACVKPIKLKAQAMGARLRKHVPRSTVDLQEVQSNQIVSTYNLRTQQLEEPSVWNNIEKKCFTDQIIMLHDEYDEIPEDLKNKYNSKSVHCVRFDEVNARAEIRRLTMILRNRISNLQQQ